MYALFHADYDPKRWHVFVAYTACSWLCCASVMYGQRILAKINDIGLFLIVAGVAITVIVLLGFPAARGSKYSPSRAVWTEWQNDTGYSSNGFVFVMGMLNGAFALGVPGKFSSRQQLELCSLLCQIVFPM
jgi:choline transport protein